MRVSSTFATSGTVSTVSPIDLISTKNGITGISRGRGERPRVPNLSERVCISQGKVSRVYREKNVTRGGSRLRPAYCSPLCREQWCTGFVSGSLLTSGTYPGNTLEDNPVPLIDANQARPPTRRFCVPGSWRSRSWPGFSSPKEPSIRVGTPWLPRTRCTPPIT